MLKRASVLIGMLLGCACLSLAQADLNKLVDAEHRFALMAAEKGTKAAFLANMADDAVVFQPDRTLAKPVWSARQESPALLSWAPNYADVSANGVLGYTTGNWEYRPKGRDDQPTGFGDFITVWLRQADGSYRWVIDMGITHDRPAQYSTDWTTSSNKARDPNTQASSAGDAAVDFLKMLHDGNSRKGYERYAAPEIRLYRENMKPFLGKKAALLQIASEKGTLVLDQKTGFFQAADLAYSNSTYARIDGGKTIEKGNYMQIWKLIGGKWQIVLDIFKVVPQK